jgi:hypothetical protein
MPVPLDRHTFVSKGSNIFVFGGGVFRNKWNSTPNDLLLHYDINQDKWTTVKQKGSSPPIGLHYAIMVVVKGEIFLFGGYDDMSVENRKVYHLDVEADSKEKGKLVGTWSLVMPLTRTRIETNTPSSYAVVGESVWVITDESQAVFQVKFSFDENTGRPQSYSCHMCDQINCSRAVGLYHAERVKMQNHFYLERPYLYLFFGDERARDFSWHYDLSTMKLDNHGTRWGGAPWMKNWTWRHFFQVLNKFV